MLIYCSKYLHNFNGNDKLSDHDSKKDSFITMFLNKRFKGNKPNALNVDGKIIVKFSKSFDNVQKQANIPMSQLVDSYSSV